MCIFQLMKSELNFEKSIPISSVLFVTPRFPRVSLVGPVGDYHDVVGNNIVKPHNYMNVQRKLKDKYNSTIDCNIECITKVECIHKGSKYK
ncbi:hypothetical protein Hanom_Chr07g00616171 [Helianthus anomalus]